MKNAILPIRPNMNITRSMAELYNLFERLKGPIEARELIVAIVYNNMVDIQDEGLPMTAEELDKRISANINDYLDVAKKTNVA